MGVSGPLDAPVDGLDQTVELGPAGRYLAIQLVHSVVPRAYERGCLKRMAVGKEDHGIEQILDVNCAERIASGECDGAPN